MDFEEIVYFIVEILGTIAFATSGAMVAISKRVDIFGVLVLSSVTALGGGCIRDILIGALPPRMFSDYRYVMVSVIVSLLVFIIAYIFRDLYQKSQKIVDSVNNIFDAVGLGVFTVTGVQVAIESGFKMNSILAVCLGVITGIGGGILRDVMLREIPFVLKKRIYALASIAGGVVYYNLYLADFGRTKSIILAVLVTFVIRILATIFRLDLPKVKLKDNNK
ncbi:MAG: trimeric intracellular cation channel family protein [Acutalibacteraceae bacterium]|nr:trimeric intracellular cation channel family protein [Acutalibacteraceae bacterium]